MKRSPVIIMALLAVAWTARTPLLRFTGSIPGRLGAGSVARSEVAFPSGNLTLRGTLHTPLPVTGLQPAVVITHGGTRLGRRLALYSFLARELARRGFVVLTFDFRGFGDSADPPRIETSADLDFVRDVSAAVSFLRGHRRVDPGRIAVVGHSFGAGVAVSAALRDERIMAAVSISPGRDTWNRFFGPDAPERGYPSRRMSADMGIDPPIPPEMFDPHLKDYVAEAILDYPRHPPVLLVDGDRERDVELRALAGIFRRMTEPKGYVTIPGADHYFGTARDQDGSREELPGDIVPLRTLADRLTGWLSGRAATR